MTGKTNKDWNAMSDANILEAIGAFIKEVRLRQNKTQADIATASGLNRWTISQLENGESVTLSSLIQVLRSLDALYVFDDFQIQDEISPLQYAKMKKLLRQRASGKKPSNENENDTLGW